MKRSLILLLLFFLNSPSAVSQAPSIEWQNDIGGDNPDFVCCIEQTTDGGYILGGYSESPISGDKTEDQLLIDYWILKLDVLGNIQWQNTIGGNGGV